MGRLGERHGLFKIIILWNPDVGSCTYWTHVVLLSAAESVLPNSKVEIDDVNVWKMMAIKVQHPFHRRHALTSQYLPRISSRFSISCFRLSSPQCHILITSAGVLGGL